MEIPKAPKPIVVMTGEQGKVQKTIDSFFSRTKNYVEKNYVVLPPSFEIKSGNIYYGLSPSNERITYLKYEDIVLASVLETRTEFNNIKYTFSRHIKKDTKKLF